MLIFFFITLFLLVLYAFLIDYYRRSWNELEIFSAEETVSLQDIDFVSVIIPARNEAKNIGACLASLAAQSYPREYFEVVVVDDHSTDETARIVSDLNYPFVKLIRLADLPNESNSRAYKKMALQVGIQNGRGGWIMTTDADCVFPAHWISTIARQYRKDKAAFIAAPVKILPKQSVLSVFQSLDFIALQGITGATVYKKIHAMCNGANLGYQKQIFEEVDGFQGIDHIASGDDMLLMYKIAQRYPGKIFYQKSQEAIVSTQPAETWKAFFQQRIRWASKAGHYSDRNIMPILLGVYVVNLFILFFLLSSPWHPLNLLYFAILWILKTLFEFPFMLTVARFFGLARLMPYFFFLQPLHVGYTVVAGAFGKFGHYEWKGRKGN